MKRYNVFIEKTQLFLAILLFLVSATFWTISVLKEMYYIYVLIAVFFSVFFIMSLVFLIPNMKSYMECKNSVAEGIAIVVDNYQKNSKLPFKKKAYILVLEYKVENITFRSANIVSEEVAKKYEIKSKAKVHLHGGKALIWL